MTNMRLAKRAISLLLVFLLLLSLFPLGVFASEPTAETVVTEESTEPAETEVEPTEETVTAEPADEEIAVIPLNLYDNGISLFARYTLTKWGAYQIFPHTSLYIDWKFPDGSEPYLNGSSGYGDATFNYPHYMEINGEPAYCIFPGVDAANLTYTDEQALDTWENGFSEAQRQAIGLIVALGYGACDFSVEPNDKMPSVLDWPADKTYQVEKYMATQILIWEIIVQDRSATYPYTLNNSRLWDSFYKAGDRWYNWPTMLKVRNEILAKMQASTAVPSFASNSAGTAPTVELKYNSGTKQYTATVTDTNAVLTNYDFNSSVSGITFSKSGNSLTITATAAAASLVNTPATASATGPSVTADPDREAIVWSAAYGQPVVTAAETVPVTAYIKLTADASGTATMKKTTTSADGDVEGYCFKIYQWGVGAWYGKTNANGDVYVTDENYTASTKTYTFDGLTDGEYTFLEVLSKKGAGDVFPNSWTITVTDTSGKTVYNKTFTTEITRDSNGDARLGTNDAKIAITGLSGGGKMTMTINNASVTGDLALVKATEDNKNLKGWRFGIYADEKCTTLISGPHTTNDKGEIDISGLPVGDVWVKELGHTDAAIGALYECESVNPQKATIVSNQTAKVSFSNKLVPGEIKIVKKTNTGGTLAGWKFNVYTDAGLKNLLDGSPFTTPDNGEIVVSVQPGTYYVQEVDESDKYPDWVYDTEVRTVTVKVKETGMVTFTNVQKGRCMIVKDMPEGGSAAGWEFDVHRISDGAYIGTFTTTEESSIITDYLLPGEYEITEKLPADSLYYCDTDNPQTVTVKAVETAEVTFTNRLKPGKISIEKVDVNGEPLADAEFLLEWSEDGKTWAPVTCSDSPYVVKGGCSSAGLKDGKLVSPENGLVTFEGLHPQLYYRLTETAAPEGYHLLAESAYEEKLPENERTVTLRVVNTPAFKLPHTGSYTPVIMPVLQGVCMTVCIALLISVRKKEN